MRELFLLLPLEREQRNERILCKHYLKEELHPERESRKGAEVRGDTEEASSDTCEQENSSFSRLVFQRQPLLVFDKSIGWWSRAHGLINSKKAKVMSCRFFGIWTECCCLLNLLWCLLPLVEITIPEEFYKLNKWLENCVTSVESAVCTTRYQKAWRSFAGHHYFNNAKSLVKLLMA